MRLRVGRQVIHVGAGPRMDCPECGERVTFDLKLDYCFIRLGVLGCASQLRWHFQCRACRAAWRAKRSLVRELERGGVPIPFWERDGLLVALLVFTLLAFLLRL